ncbi:hypothetical protein [Flavobacterium sp.]|uniref:hypothetical protein n=1 Tax=Flavobacterium sp. TaxID=239 RepID=UPI002635B35E|nr:hypothetical protein [Flavobacterium sp.]
MNALEKGEGIKKGTKTTVIMSQLVLQKIYNFLKKAIPLCVLLASYSCKERSFNEPTENINDLHKKFKKGDLISYEKLKTTYLDYTPEIFIPIAKYAADSLRYIPAHLDVFESYFDKYNFDHDSVEKADLIKMSKNDRTEALYYLEKAIRYDDTLANRYKVLLAESR